jgi:hypothetical protein
MGLDVAATTPTLRRAARDKRNFIFNFGTGYYGGEKRRFEDLKNHPKKRSK